MQRILSTYLFVAKRLTRELLTQIDGAGFQGVEIFATRSHFDYATKAEVRSLRRRSRTIVCNSARCMHPPAGT